MPYNLFQHKHNFSVWAGARASQRGFTNVENLKNALEQCGVVEYLRNNNLYVETKAFNALHEQWCDSIVNYLTQRKIEKVTFGRAAKLLAVYLKSMIVVGGHADSLLAKVAHPPIDRILLKNLSKSKVINPSVKTKLQNINWTELNKKDYYILVRQLKSCLNSDEPFWHIEKYWTVTND